MQQWRFQHVPICEEKLKVDGAQGDIRWNSKLDPVDSKGDDKNT
jgi:hypothetical protein